jgi:hypothetical protein
MIKVLGLIVIGVLIGMFSTQLSLSKPTLNIPTEFQCTHQRPDSKVNIKKIAKKVSEHFGNSDEN